MFLIMQEFFLIIDNNDNDHTWCNAYDYALLPLQKDASNLIKYIKVRYSLTDSEFDELLRESDDEIAYIDSLIKPME